jgi:hypothetical protein
MLGVNTGGDVFHTMLDVCGVLVSVTEPPIQNGFGPIVVMFTVGEVETSIVNGGEVAEHLGSVTVTV